MPHMVLQRPAQGPTLGRRTAYNAVQGWQAVPVTVYPGYPSAVQGTQPLPPTHPPARAPPA